MTRDVGDCFTPPYSYQSLSWFLTSKRFILLKHGVNDREELSRHRHFGRAPAPAPHHSAVQFLKIRIPAGGMGADLHQDPAQPPRTLFGDPAIVSLASRTVDAGHQAGVGTQVLGVGKSPDLANLTED
jgi:hypothetical protein